MAQRLAGRVALVTGGSRGIGAAIAGRLAQEGAAVVVSYQAREDAARQVTGRIIAAGSRATCVRADLRVEAECHRLVDDSIRSFGRLDILVNNAGVAVLGEALSMSAAQLDEAMGLALHAPLWCTQFAAGHLAAHGCGRVINISSIGAMATAVGGLVPYAVAKASLNMLTKRLAVELGPRGVTVNAICPGLIETGMGEATEAIGEFADMHANPAATTMLGRVGRPGDIAGVAAFMASDDGAFLTAQCLTVDGGRLDLLSRSA
jgi:3-oxoacyl-[acyl-carrier protein] reductase